MKFNIIPEWNKKDLECHFCGTHKSVKYKANVNGNKVYVCNKCVLMKDDLLEDSQTDVE